jgi:putative inorganic carbon (HCO3(-)) transporter
MGCSSVNAVSASIDESYEPPTQAVSRRVGDKASFGIFLLLLAWIPIPFGSNRPWAWSLFEAVTFGLLAAWLVRAALGRAEWPVAWDTLRVPLVLLGVWLVLFLVQLVPIPMPLLKLASPDRYAVYAPGSPSVGFLSLAPAATLEAFLKAVAYVGMLFLTVALIRTRERLAVLATWLLVIGAGEALFGFYVYATHLDFIPEALRDGHWDLLTGTFVNRNHFAALLAAIIPVWIGLLMGGARRRRRGYRDRLRRALRFLVSWRILALLIVLLLTAALLMSKSRGGNLSLLLALVLVAGVAALRRGIRAPEVRVVAVVLALALAGGAWVGLGALKNRLEHAPEEAGDRLLTWHRTLALFADYPMLGAGAGSYASVFPRYKDPKMFPLLYDHAHNDYLELLAEQGIVGFAVLAVAVLWILKRVLAAYLSRHDRFMRGMLFASLAGSAATLSHSLVDFSLQIPADAALLFLLLGIGVVAAATERRSKGRPP